MRVAVFLWLGIVALVLASMLPLRLYAQTWGGPYRIDPYRMRLHYMDVRMIDSASIRVFYDCTEYRDGESFSMPMVLLVGDRYSQFMEYSSYQRDSLSMRILRDSPVSRDSMERILVRRYPLPYWFRITFQRFPREDKHLVEIMGCRDQADTLCWGYSTNKFALPWELVEGRDTVIAGFPCKLARCYLSPDSFEVWYTPNSDLKFGPRIFYNFPGLVIEATVEHLGSTTHYKYRDLEKLDRPYPVYSRLAFDRYPGPLQWPYVVRVGRICRVGI